MNTPAQVHPDGAGASGRRGRPPSISAVSPLVALVVGLLLGGVVVATVILRTRRDEGGPPPDPQVLAVPEAALARRLFDLMDTAVVLVDVDDAVLLANPAARALGVVRGNRLVVHEL